MADEEYDDDESLTEADGIPIDADLENADWPKRTPDTLEALQAAIDAKGPRRPFIEGRGWYAWLDYDVMDWDSDEPEKAPLKMIREGFGKEKVDWYVESDKTLRELYADVAAFLGQWGVAAAVTD